MTALTIDTRPTAATRGRKGDGSVTWVAARGKYRVRVPREDDPGRPIERWSPGPQSPAAERAAHALRTSLVADRDRGAPVVARDLTVAAWLEEWMALQASKRPATVRAYRARIDQYLIPTLGRYRLADLDARHIQRAYDRLRERPSARRDGLSESTILAAHKVLTAALNDALHANPPKVATNQARRVRVIDDAPEIEPPTIDQVQALFDGCDPDDPMRAYYLVAYWTGARQGELTGVRWSDIDWTGRTITYRRQAPQRGDQDRTRRRLKAGRARSVVVPQAVLDVLAALPRHATSPLVFQHTDGTGRALTQGIIRGHFDRVTAALDLRPPTGSDVDHFRPHDLRHAWATLMLEAGASSPLVQAAGGWSSPAQLDRYGHVRPQRGGRAYRLVIDALGDDATWYGIR
jgi:integrase